MRMGDSAERLQWVSKPGTGSVNKIFDYRQKAAECRALAPVVRREDARESLLAMARSWERMAEARAEALEPDLELAGAEA